MREPCPGCGHRHVRHPYTGDKVPLTATDLAEPARLVDLLARRPELDGIGLARLAQATTEVA